MTPYRQTVGETSAAESSNLEYNCAWRQTLEQGEHRQAFGAGELDRSALGSLIFSNPNERRKLNKATHLPVYVEMCRQLFIHWLSCKALVVSPQLFWAVLRALCVPPLASTPAMPLDCCCESHRHCAGRGNFSTLCAVCGHASALRDWLVQVLPTDSPGHMFPGDPGEKECSIDRIIITRCLCLSVMWIQSMQMSKSCGADKAADGEGQLHPGASSGQGGLADAFGGETQTDHELHR